MKDIKFFKEAIKEAETYDSLPKKKSIALNV